MFGEVKRPSFIVVLLLSTILRVAFALYTPNWQAPDEYPHFYVVKHLAFTGHMAKSKPEFPSYEGYQPPLYYFLAAQLYKVVIGWDTLPRDPNYSTDPDTNKEPRNLALLTLRLFSVALGAVTLIMIAKAGTLFFSGEPQLTLLAASFAGFLPTFVVNSSSVTNDALANLIGALLIWFMLQPGRPKQTVWMGILLGLGILTKASLWMFVPLALAALAIQQKSFFAGLKKFWIVLGISAALSGWFFVRNYTTYGSLLAFNPGVETTIPLLNHSAVDFWRVVRNMNWSFWAAAGRIYGIHLPAMFYVVVFLPVTLVALAGVAKSFTGRRPEAESSSFRIPETSKTQLLILILTFVMESFGALYYSLMYPVNCAWGKYLYPVMPAIAILLVAGTYRMLGGTMAGRVLQIFNLVLLGVSGYLLWMAASR